MKYRKKPIVIEAITFDEFVEYDKGHNMILGTKPWVSFMGYPVTRSDDGYYLITTLEGEMRFTPADMLIIGVKGEIYPCKIDIFQATYEEVKE